MRPLALAILLLLAPALAGCAAPGAGPGSDRTGGISLELSARSSDELSAVRYRLDRDGTLHFGGGMDAHRGRFSWSGPMQEQELRELVGLLDRFDWLERPPRGTGEADDPRRRIELATPAGRRRIDLAGPNAEVDQVQALLRDAALRRHQPVLDQLPQPGPR